MTSGEAVKQGHVTQQHVEAQLDLVWVLGPPAAKHTEAHSDASGREFHAVGKEGSRITIPPPQFQGHPMPWILYCSI